MSYKYKLDVFFSLIDHGKHIGMLIFMTRCIWTPYSSNSNMAAVQKKAVWPVVRALHLIVRANSSTSTKFGTDVAEGILK